MEKLFVDHSSAVAKFEMLSFSDGVRIPWFTIGYPILPTNNSGADFPEKWSFGFGALSMNLSRMMQCFPHSPLPLHLIQRVSMWRYGR